MQANRAESLLGMIEVIKNEEERLKKEAPKLHRLLIKPTDELQRVFSNIKQGIHTAKEGVKEYLSERIGQEMKASLLLASSSDATERDLKQLSTYPVEAVRKKVAKNKNTPLRILVDMRRAHENRGFMSAIDVLAHPNADNTFKENFIRHSTSITPTEIQWMLDADEVYTKAKNYQYAENSYKLTFASLEMLLANDFSSEDYLKNLNLEDKGWAKELSTQNKSRLETLLKGKLTLHKEQPFKLEYIEALLQSESPLAIYAAGTIPNASPAQVGEAFDRLVDAGENKLAEQLKDEKEGEMPSHSVKIEKTQQGSTVERTLGS